MVEGVLKTEGGKTGGAGKKIGKLTEFENFCSKKSATLNFLLNLKHYKIIYFTNWSETHTGEDV